MQRRPKNIGLETEIGCHTFGATSITDYLTNGGCIEVAQRMTIVAFTWPPHMTGSSYSLGLIRIERAVGDAAMSGVR